MKTLIKNAIIINEGLKFNGSVLIDGEKIDKVFPYKIPSDYDSTGFEVVNATGIDTQRQPDF
jgi:dihydroorotase